MNTGNSAAVASRFGRTLFVAALLLTTAGALAFRLPRLDLRPMHTDEAVHTVKAGMLIETGAYAYDPHEYHGPTIYYFALPFVWLSGARSLADTSEWMFRIVPVLFGAGLVLLLLLVRDGLGRWEAVCAGALTAISPAMVFYSRYYIQEMLFVFFTFGLIACGWRYARSRRLGWALLAGLCLGLMQATKETSVIVVAALVIALGVTEAPGWRNRTGVLPPDAARTGWYVLAGLALAALVCMTVVSGFFTHPRGALDIFLTYFNYIERADGAATHDHPWHYYLQLLLGLGQTSKPRWNERLIVVMAVAGAFVAWRRKAEGPSDPRLLRFLAVYTVALTALYSVIPYKTPWCMLGFLHGMILLAGVGIAGVVRWLPSGRFRLLIVAVLAIAAYQLGYRAYQANFRFYADPRNPYVYAHTSTDLMHLVQRIGEVAQVAPDGRNTLIKVITPDSWPLPWYLRQYPHVGYWHELIEDPDAPIVITSAEWQPELEQRMHETYQIECYGQRPDILMTMFIRRDLWDAFIKTRS